MALAKLKWPVSANIKNDAPAKSAIQRRAEGLNGRQYRPPTRLAEKKERASLLGSILLRASRGQGRQTLFHVCDIVPFPLLVPPFISTPSIPVLAVTRVFGSVSRQLNDYTTGALLSCQDISLPCVLSLPALRTALANNRPWGRRAFLVVSYNQIGLSRCRDLPLAL